MESRNYLQFAAAGYYIQYLLSIYTIYCIRVGGNCPTEAHYYILPVTGELPHTGTLLTRELLQLENYARSNMEPPEP